MLNRRTYTQHALYAQPVGKSEDMTGNTGAPLFPPPPPPPPLSPPPPVWMGGRFVPVKLYALSRLGPPQISELLPAQTMLQSVRGAEAPPFPIADAQSRRKTAQVELKER